MGCFRLGFLALVVLVGGAAAAPISEADCEARANDSAAKLVECIKQPVLWRQLSAFQRIADDNPGPDGHDNRDTGTPGYKASVEHVAALMRAAGYRVTVQPYNWTKIDGEKSDIDYNLIADSPFGDPEHVVVLEGHLDSIYGAGMLDNASGSTTILEIALNMANTPTRNQLRYIWFGGEELGLLGSKYYTRNLTKEELGRIDFDIDADVTATPNFAIIVADPRFAPNRKRFPPNVIPESKVGNQDFAEYFRSIGVISRPGAGGNTGTDSNSFSLAGVPNTGILTQQDCCKHGWDVRDWGGVLGNYEGKIPSRNGGCVDHPHRWCDNLSNNDPFVFEMVSRSVAYVTWKLANDLSIRH